MAFGYGVSPAQRADLVKRLEREVREAAARGDDAMDLRRELEVARRRLASWQAQFGE